MKGNKEGLDGLRSELKVLVIMEEENRIFEVVIKSYEKEINVFCKLVFN